MEKEFTVKMTDGIDIYVKKWYQSEGKPTAIVQLAHGMMEHINRYNEFATYLSENNIFVYGNDHRGHGQTGSKQNQFGYLADEHGFKRATDDVYEVTTEIKKVYPNIPLFLFGHSMGSFLARKYIQTYSHHIDGAILSGTGYFPYLMTITAKSLASILPPKEKSHIMNFLAFGQYNKKIDNPKTKFDWLTRDEQAVQAYIDDPYTGFIPTSRFFYDLMSGIQIIQKQSLNKRIPKELPMCFISGDDDPVGNYAKGVWRAAHLYEQIGMKDIQVRLFDKGRHELLSELNKDEVYLVVYEWIKNKIE